jgi:CheY-like chemotaxis protein
VTVLIFETPFAVAAASSEPRREVGIIPFARSGPHFAAIWRRTGVHAPLRPDDAAPTLSAAGEIEMEGRAVTSAGRALVVDDHAGCRRALEELAAAAGFEVVASADSGEAALAAAAALEPDFVLLDVRMPGIGGRAAASILAARHPEMVVLLVSETSPTSAGDVVPKSALSADLLRSLWRVRAPGGGSHPLPAHARDRSLGAG